MRIATWNVNSIRTRHGRVVDWLVNADVDALAMQEIKCTPEQFPMQPFEDAGYEVVLHGLNQWNGVAIASRRPMTDIEIGFAGQPGFAKGHDADSGQDAPLEARAIGATINDVRLWSLYVPNGRALDDLHMDYKLRFLRALADDNARWLREHPGSPLALTGDFNVAPLDTDVGDPSFIPGVSTHISPAERAAFATLEQSGLTDVVRPLVPTGYTFWDYKQLRFPRNEGMRIDFVLGSEGFADRVVGAHIEREQRKGDAPSDHVPVVVDLHGNDDNDDRPMIF